MSVEAARFRDLKLGDPVQVTLPTFVWMSFAASYGTCDWNDPYATQIQQAALEAILDPIYVKEQQAAAQEAHDQAHAQFHHFVTGQPPEVPPHMEDPNE